MKKNNFIFNIPGMGILKSKPIEGIEGMSRLEFEAKGQFIIKENTCERIGRDYSVYYKTHVKPYLIEHVVDVYLSGKAVYLDIILDVLTVHVEEVSDYIKKLLLEDYEANS